MEHDEPGLDPALAALGWDAGRAAAFTADGHAARDLVPARVIAADGPSLLVAGDDEAGDGKAGPGEYRAVLAGRMRHQTVARAELPVVGDWVAVKPGRDGGQAVVQSVLPRRTWFARGREGASEQVVAANLDELLLVAGLDGDFNLRRLERYLAMAWEGGAQPVIVLNKADVSADPEGEAERAAAVAPGVPILLTSSKTGLGMDELAARFGPGRTTALLGSSGVGKSSLTNVLLGADRQATAGLRGDGRGRHTTTRRELLRLPGGGLLIDTPGLRTVVLGEVDEDLGGSFADIEELAAQCRFADCHHDKEPGCAVTAAVAEGRLDPERFAAWQKLQRELIWQATREDPRAAAARRQDWRAIHKAMRGHNRP
jgi:ribosome biogenesis GTPase